MPSSTESKDWGSLIEMLNEGNSSLNKRKAQPFVQSISLFHKASKQWGLDDLKDLAEKFALFFKKLVLPHWDEEAVATLSFALGALVEKMQMVPYGEKFSSELSEITAFLEVYGEEEADGPTASAGSLDAQASQALIPETPATEKARAATSTESKGEVLLEGTRRSLDEDEQESVPHIETRRPQAPDMEPLESVGPSSADAKAKETETSSLEPPPLPSPVDLSGPLEGARELYSQMLKLDPGSQVFVYLAEELCAEKRWNEAAKICRQGLLLHPLSIRARVLLGWALWELGGLEEAESVLQEARRELEKNAGLYRLLSEAATRRGDTDRASRLMNIYEMLQEMEEPPVQRGEPTAERDIPSSRHVGKIPPAGFLRALLHRYEKKPSIGVTPQALFSEDARETMRSMLRNRRK